MNEITHRRPAGALAVASGVGGVARFRYVEPLELSIVVPAYNEQGRLPQRLDTILT